MRGRPKPHDATAGNLHGAVLLVLERIGVGVRPHGLHRVHLPGTGLQRVRGGRGWPDLVFLADDHDYNHEHDDDEYDDNQHDDAPAVFLLHSHFVHKPVSGTGDTVL